MYIHTPIHKYMSIHTFTYIGGAKVPNKVTGEGFSQINLSLSFVATAKVSSEAARANASGVLQCVAVCCSVLQCGASEAARANASDVLQRIVVFCSVVYPQMLLTLLQCAAVCCSVLQCNVVCCSVLQYVAVSCSVLCPRRLVVPTREVRCSVLQCVTACCSVLYSREFLCVYIHIELLWDLRIYIYIHICKCKHVFIYFICICSYIYIYRATMESATPE